MFELLLNGFGAVFSLNILVLVTVGVAVGIVFGAVPGLTAVMAIALVVDGLLVLFGRVMMPWAPRRTATRRVPSRTAEAA